MRLQDSRALFLGSTMRDERTLRTTADLQPGDHACGLWETKEERHAALQPFLRQGLEQGEKVLYLVDAPIAELGLGYLQDSGLDAAPYLARGQLTIRTCRDTYMQEGVFDPDRMIALLRAETGRALDEGYSALRVAGEMTWALRGLSGSERLIEYEVKLNGFFLGGNCLAVCQYERRAFTAALLLDALRTHPIIVVDTEIYHNRDYLAYANFLGDQRPATQLRNWLESLAQQRPMENDLSTAREAIEDSVERRLQRRNVYHLTFRELMVLFLVAAGKSDRDIATILGIRDLTAQKHVSNILKKMGVTSRTAATARAIREGLVD